MTSARQFRPAFKVWSTYLGAASTSLERLWTWWSSTLAGMIPERVKELALEHPDLLNVYVQNGQYFVSGSNGATALFDLDSFAENSREQKPLTLVLSPDEVATRQQTLPVSARGRLRDILALQAQTETPFAADQIVTDFRILPEGDLTEINVEQAIVLRDRLQIHLDTLTDRGFEIARIDIGTPEEGTMGFDLSERTSKDAGSSLPSLAIFLSAVIVLSLAGWVALAFIKQSDRVRVVQAEMDSLQLDADLSLQARAQVMESIESLAALEKRISNPAKFQTVYEAMAEAIPDHSWIYALDYTKSTLTISGLSRMPEDLIAQLEASDAFESVQFTSSLLNNAQIGADRFSLELKLHAEERTQ